MSAPKLVRRHRVVDPDVETTTVTREVVERAAGVRARRRQIAKRVETVDVPGADQPPQHLAPGLVGVPVGELVGRHVEVDAVADLESDAASHRGLFRRVEEAGASRDRRDGRASRRGRCRSRGPPCTDRAPREPGRAAMWARGRAIRRPSVCEA